MLRKTTRRHPLYSRREVFKSYFKTVFYDLIKNWKFYIRGCGSGALCQAPITFTEKNKINNHLADLHLTISLFTGPLHAKAKIESS